MRAAGLALAWSLSLAPLVLETASGGRLAFAGASHLGLSALPWLALAGLPRARRSDAGAGTVLLPAALALPVLALGAGLDVATPLGTGGVAEPLMRAGLVLVLILVWSGAAELARARGRAGSYGLAWTILVPGAAALATALLWAPRSAAASAAPGWATGLAASPLVWAAGWTAADGRAGPGATAGLLPLVAAALVLVSVGRPRAASEPGR